jgi:hypothetical protein
LSMLEIFQVRHIGFLKSILSDGHYIQACRLLQLRGFRMEGMVFGVGMMATLQQQVIQAHLYPSNGKKLFECLQQSKWSF